MPDFASPFAGLASSRPLTASELVRAIRFLVAAEYEAVQMYTQLAESTGNTLAQTVLTDIANEERVHAGEFLRLLKELAPDEEQFYTQGAAEVQALIGGTAHAAAAPPTPPPAPANGSGLGIGALRA
jgi:rubrerythrin